MLINKISLFCERSKMIMTLFVSLFFVFLGRQKIFTRMTATIFRMAMTMEISSHDVNTGQARCSLFSPALGTQWDFRMFGASPTLCTKVVEVGRKKKASNDAPVY
jgi:hypothetical protein